MQAPCRRRPASDEVYAGQSRQSSCLSHVANGERAEAQGLHNPPLAGQHVSDALGHRRLKCRIPRVSVQPRFVPAPTVAAPKSIASRARSGLLTLTFAIRQLPNPRNWATADGSNDVSGRPGEAPGYAGTDFIIARDGRIAALYSFRQATLSCRRYRDAAASPIDRS
jgi:hypothetical protein